MSTAVAYAMLIEKSLGKRAKKAVIRHMLDSKSFEILMTDDLRRHMRWVVSRIRSIVEGKRCRGKRVRGSAETVDLGGPVRERKVHDASGSDIALAHSRGR